MEYTIYWFGFSEQFQSIFLQDLKEKNNRGYFKKNSYPWIKYFQGNTPHVIYGKPFAHISLPDWESKILQNHQTNDTRRSDGFNLRYESRKLRNEKKIETDWNTHRSNNHLDERLTETETWKEVCMHRVEMICLFQIS